MAIDTLICCVVPILVSIALSQSIHLTKWWNESAWPCISRLLFGDKVCVGGEKSILRIVIIILKSLWGMLFSHCHLARTQDANKGPVFMRIINHKSQLGAYHSGVQTDKTKQLMTVS